MTIFKRAFAVRQGADCMLFRPRGASLVLLRRTDAELLELAVEMGALEPALLCESRDRRVAREMVLKVSAFERFARLPQRYIERKAAERRLPAGAHQDPFDIG